MLTLRPRQLEALTQSRRLDFEARLRVHLGRTFPAATRKMSEAELDQAIREGIRRAVGHGIATERDTCKFISLRFVLGRDFDRDPQLPWVREILDGARVHRGLSPIDLLVQEAQRRESAAGGSDVRRAI